MNETVTNTVIELGAFEKLSLFMNEGGIFMWIILILWLIGLTIVIERFLTLFKFDTNGEKLMGHIKNCLLNNDIAKAINDCNDKPSLLSKILKNTLLRANQTREKIQDAIESSYLENSFLAEKRLNFIGLLANISTLIGLLGTIQGLIDSFAAVASADPSEKSIHLAKGISKAMNTTVFGLISAITLMFFHNFLTTKANKIVSELEEYSTKLMDILTSRS